MHFDFTLVNLGTEIEHKAFTCNHRIACIAIKQRGNQLGNQRISNPNNPVEIVNATD